MANQGGVSGFPRSPTRSIRRHSTQDNDAQTNFWANFIADSPIRWGSRRSRLVGSARCECDPSLIGQLQTFEKNASDFDLPRAGSSRRASTTNCSPSSTLGAEVDAMIKGLKTGNAALVAAAADHPRQFRRRRRQQYPGDGRHLQSRRPDRGRRAVDGGAGSCGRRRTSAARRQRRRPASAPALHNRGGQRAPARHRPARPSFGGRRHSAPHGKFDVAHHFHHLWEITAAPAPPSLPVGMRTGGWRSYRSGALPASGEGLSSPHVGEARLK